MPKHDKSIAIRFDLADSRLSRPTIWSSYLDVDRLEPQSKLSHFELWHSYAIQEQGGKLRHDDFQFSTTVHSIKFVDGEPLKWDLLEQ